MLPNSAKSPRNARWTPTAREKQHVRNTPTNQTKQKPPKHNKQQTKPLENQTELFQWFYTIMSRVRHHYLTLPGWNCKAGNDRQQRRQSLCFLPPFIFFLNPCCAHVFLPPFRQYRVSNHKIRSWPLRNFRMKKRQCTKTGKYCRQAWVGARCEAIQHLKRNADARTCQKLELAYDCRCFCLACTYLHKFRKRSSVTKLEEWQKINEANEKLNLLEITSNKSTAEIKRGPQTVR